LQIAEWNRSNISRRKPLPLNSASAFGCVPLLQKFEHFFIVEGVSGAGVQDEAPELLSTTTPQVYAC
jgi:hypothetical protein